MINANTNGGIPASNPFYFSLNNSVNKPDITQGFRPAKLTDAIYTYGDVTWRDMLTVSYSVRNDYNSTLTLANGSGDYSFVYPSVGASFIFSNLLKDNPVSVS